MQDSARLRKEILAARDRLLPEAVTEKSGRIANRLMSLQEVQAVGHVFIYVSFRSEVETQGMISALLGAGKEVSVPLTRVGQKRLDVIRITDPVADLVPGYCGIPEPTAEVCAQNTVEPHTIDCVVLPGSVFDERCGRFGYGGGYYDRLLASIPHACRIGLAYELQVVPLAPLAPHDELLDLVVTEERVIRGKRRS